ncbi:hypothetical protein [Cyclobacterium lianum]|uniref:hypothetical protein n=1 Tax=Cyclobacterium lianum TaxID=388280 RepID=UPI001160C7BD|nr:hypothetical protein [Cyclobacterium lianum]
MPDNKKQKVLPESQREERSTSGARKFFHSQILSGTFKTPGKKYIKTATDIIFMLRSGQVTSIFIFQHCQNPTHWLLTALVLISAYMPYLCPIKKKV